MLSVNEVDSLCSVAEQKDEECDATNADSSNIAGNTIIQLYRFKELHIKNECSPKSPP